MRPPEHLDLPGPPGGSPPQSPLGTSPNGPSDGCLTRYVLGPPVAVCLPGLLGYVGYVFLLTAFCAARVSPWSGVCVAAIVAFYAYAWASELKLLPAIGLAAGFLSVMTALVSLFSGHGASATVLLIVALVLLVPSLGEAKKSELKWLRRPEEGWVGGLLIIYWKLCGALWVLGSLTLTASHLLFGLESDPFGVGITVGGDFPYLTFKCGGIESAASELPDA